MKKKKKHKKSAKGEFSSLRLYDSLLFVFRKNPNQKFNYKRMSKILSIKEQGIKMQIVSIMKKMDANGIIREEGRGVYRLAKTALTIVSTIKNANTRGVYANIDNENEVFIPTVSSQFTLAGDKVEISVFLKRKKGYEGEVTKVIDRRKKSFVGIIDESSLNYFLIPDDKKIPFDVFIPPKTIKKNYLNKKVLVTVDGWDNKHKNPVGKVVRVIGKINDPNSEINSILYDYGFSSLFPKPVSLASEKIKDQIPKSEIKNRLDLRSIPTFTIDPKDAKDFDDALSVKKLSVGKWEIGVHIADVSYYVKKDGVIDKEAAKRATSVYLVDRVIPMLPEVLSNNICSLRPNVDRLAYSVIFEMNEQGNLINYKINKTILRSDFRFTYQTAQDVIDNKKGEFSKELLLLNKLSKILRKKRMLEGGINFERSEVKFVLDNELNPINVYFKESLSTNHLIEEFMLLANKTVAKHINSSKKPIRPFVYRVHDLPDNNRVSTLSSLIKQFGHTINPTSSKKLSKSLNLLLKKVKGKKEQHLVEMLAIRSMAKALYSTNNIGHYGLAFDHYSHFTSPIRRYPDLLVHRLLEDSFAGSRIANKDVLESLCKHCSQMEGLATAAERDSIKYMQIKYLASKIGKTYEGIISGVKEWGLYIEIIDNKCEGLVRVSSIKDDHYIYDEKKQSLVGYRTKISYQIGQKVKVKIHNANLERKQVEFIIV